MKKTELATIVIIAAISVGIAYFVANSIFGGAKNDAVTVKTIDPISSTVVPVDTSIFNNNAINPAIPVTITGQ
jgi:ABC-type cobalt transport system substrate-binding protein